MDELWGAYWGSRSTEDRNRLVERYLHLVPEVVRRIRVPSWCNPEELESPGYEGLIDAVETYDPDKSSFEYYARRKIRWAVVDYARQQDHLPRNRRDFLRKRRAAEQECGGSDEEAADYLGMSLDDYLRSRALAEVEFHSIEDLDRFVDPKEDTSDFWEEVAAKVTGTDYDVIYMLYKLGMTVPQVAEELGLDLWVVDAHEFRALTKLRRLPDD